MSFNNFAELYDAVNNDGLFDIIGKHFNAQNVLNTARLTTVPVDVKEILTIFQGLAAADLTFDTQKAIDTIASGMLTWQDSSNTFASVLNTSARNYMTEICKQSSEQPPDTLTAILEYLVFEMDRLLAYVDANAVTLTLAKDPDAIDNIGDVAVLYTERRGDGRVQQNALAEVVDVEVTSDGNALGPVLTFAGERAERNRLSYKWPAGSGVTQQVTAIDPADTLLSNGTFETTTIANVPDDWQITVGSPGNTVVVTNPEIQTVVIANDPVAGSYLLHWVDQDGTQRSTATLAYNASGSSVQTALQAIPGLESVTVVTTGTSPNYTHTVTFTGTAGNLSQLTSTSHLITGAVAPTITHATTRAGNDGAYRGRSLGIAGDGSELTELMQPLTLVKEQVYFCHLRIRRFRDVVGEATSSSSSSVVSSSSSSSSNSSSSSSTSSATGSSSSSSTEESSSTEQTSSSSSTEQTSSSSSSPSSFTVSSSSSSSTSESSRSSGSTSSASGSSPSESESSSSSLSGEGMRVEIVEGLDEAVTNDSTGNTNVLRIDLTTVSTAKHDSEFFAFRLARDPVAPVYLRIRLVNALPVGEVIYLDDVVVFAATELYAGGPFVGSVIGKDAAVVEDNWSLTVTNDSGGDWQEWFHRAFDMAGKGLLLPTTGVNAIPDAVIG